jgi:hypothetical protein
MEPPTSLPGLHVQTNIYAIEAEKLEKGLGDISVLARKQLRSPLQNGGTASKTDECLREFQHDVAAAHKQMARKAIEIECLYVHKRLAARRPRMSETAA